MFIHNEIFKKLITCQVCQDVFIDPRILPCGNTVCNDCILNAFEKRGNEIKCKICNKTHEIPNEGFNVNILIQEAAQQKPQEVYRGKDVKELRDRLDSINKMNEELKKNLNYGTDEIREFCISLRNKVHLESEIMIERIHSFDQELIKEINQYEINCIESFEALNKSNKGINKTTEILLEEIDKFYSDKFEYLSQFQIDDTEIDSSIITAKNLFNRLNIQDNDLKRAKFNNQLLEFHKSINSVDSSLLGVLIYKPIDDLNKFPMHLVDSQSLSSDNFAFFKSEDKFVAFYLDTNKYLNLVTFSEEGQTLKQENKFISAQINSFKCVQFNDQFVLYIHRVNNSAFSINGVYITSNSCNGFIVIDKNFNFIQNKSRTCHSIVSSNSKNIFLYFSNNSFYCCSSALQALKFSKPETIPDFDKINCFVTNDENFFILFNDNGTSRLRICDINDIKVIEEIDANGSEQLKLISDKYLLLFNSKTNMMNIYNQSNDFNLLVNGYLLDTTENDLKISSDRGMTLYFYSQSSNSFIGANIDSILIKQSII